jgi:hypothetical protein
MIDKTLNRSASSGLYGAPNSTIAWAMDTFRLSYTPEDLRATIEGILVERRTDGGFEINIRANYEGTEQVYEGSCWGSDSLDKRTTDAITSMQKQIDLLRIHLDDEISTRTTELEVNEMIAEAFGEFPSETRIEEMLERGLDDYVEIGDIIPRIRECISELINDGDLRIESSVELELR